MVPPHAYSLLRRMREDTQPQAQAQAFCWMTDHLTVLLSASVENVIFLLFGNQNESGNLDAGKTCAVFECPRGSLRLGSASPSFPRLCWKSPCAGLPTSLTGPRILPHHRAHVGLLSWLEQTRRMLWGLVHRFFINYKIHLDLFFKSCLKIQYYLWPRMPPFIPSL